MKKILIGKIISAFGIKGEVKILSYCKNPLDIEKYNLFDSKGNIIKIKITSSKNKNSIKYNSSKEAILTSTIDGIDNRNDAEKIAKTELFVNRDDFPNLEEDEFYHVDLIGLNVINQEDVIVGKVKNIYDFGAGEMLEIEFLESNKNLNLEKIETFAFKNEFFPEIKIKSGTIKLSIPEINIVKN